MRLSGREVGLRINFQVAHLRDGIKRMVDGYDWAKTSSTREETLDRGKTEVHNSSLFLALPRALRG